MIRVTNPKGFTLIELLIVVAIIAILAAIAVPNFLEAQTRSKVARCKADMRTVATAIEEYTIDYNRPLLDAGSWKFLLGESTLRDLLWVYSPLTTPIAYITSIPKDPFTVQVPGNITGHEGTYWPSYRYHYMRPGKKPTSDDSICLTMGYTWDIMSMGPSRQVETPDGVSAYPPKIMSGPGSPLRV